MRKTILLYSLGIATAAFALQWLDYLYTVRTLSTEIYVVIVAVAFAAFGVWVGNRLTLRRPLAQIVVNERAIAYLGISKREYEVLRLLAEGLSNQEIADKLFVSGNTVKSHLSSLYAKLDVSRRTQAVQKARSLHIIG